MSDHSQASNPPGEGVYMHSFHLVPSTKAVTVAGANKVGSVSRRRLASNKPTLQCNLHLPKHPYMQRSTSSASLSPLSTSSVTLNYFLSKVATSTPITPVDQIIHTPQQPSTPPRVVTQKQHVYSFVSNSDSSASATSVISSSLYGDALCARYDLPRRLSYQRRNSGLAETGYCRAMNSPVFLGDSEPLGSPAVV